VPHDLCELRGGLSRIVGEGQVLEGAAAGPFSVDDMVPRLAVRPGSQEEVEAVVLACGKAGAAMVPFGGGTAMGLGNPPRRLDVVVCLDRLGRIVDFSEANLNVSVEAGVRLADLKAVLAEKREFLPLDPRGPDRATVGGLLATNASGPSRLSYGTARDFVLGLRVVLASGERIRCGGKVVKNVSGYDMNKLFTGSMGTLGIITEATFKLLPVPAMRVAVIGVFRELVGVGAAVATVLESQLLPEALEALDTHAMGAIASALGLAQASGYGLAAMVAGNRETVERQVRDCGSLFSQCGATIVPPLSDLQSAVAWQTAGDASARLSGTSGDRVSVKIAVPIARTLDLFESAELLGRSSGGGVVTAHAGSGIVRATYLLDRGVMRRFRNGLESLRERAEGVEGCLTVEEAPVVLKHSLDAWGKPPEALAVMRRLKNEFDPGGLFNPGRFLAGM